MIKAVFFDWVVTLAHPEPDSHEIVHQVAKGLGIELPPQGLIKGLHVAENQMPWGAPPMWREGKDEEAFIRWWEIVLAEVGVKLSREVMLEMTRRLSQVARNLTWVLYDDALPTIKTLKQQGLILGVISNLPIDRSASVSLEPYLDFLSISICRVLYKKRGIYEFKEPKTSHSRRRVAMTPKLALFLRAYWTERERLYHGLGKQLSLDDLVFASPEGKPIDPCVLTHNFTKVAKQASLNGIRFHDLRHTFASLMLLRGAKPKVISEALGHSSVAFTMDVYSHIIEGMQSDAMALLDEVLPAGVNKNSVAKMSPILENLAPKQGNLASSPCSSGG